MKRQQIKQQKQITAYEKQVTYDLLLMSIEWLEKYIEVTHKNEFPDWKKRKQIHDNNIKRTDIDGKPDMAKDTLSTQLLLLEANLRRRPEFIREEIKGEYYKWISATGINANNCPEKLKQLLFGINEILEGRGEKIRKEVETERPIASVEEMKDVFVHSHLVAKKEDETQKLLSNKTYRDVEIGGKFGSGSVEQGEKAFEQIARNVSGNQNFHYFPSQEQSQTPKRVNGSRYDSDIKLRDNGQELVYDKPVDENEINQLWTNQLNSNERSLIEQESQKAINNPNSEEKYWLLGGGSLVVVIGNWGYWIWRKKR